jgi:hypothetical protein
MGLPEKNFLVAPTQKEAELNGVKVEKTIFDSAP